MNAELRRTLLKLHRLLLEHQRRQVEKITGRMSPGQLLQAATQDLRFSWINELFEPIAALDAAVSYGVEPDPEGSFGRRYLEVMQADPEVVLVHREVTAELTP